MQRMQAFIDRPGFGRFITAVIMLNAVVLGMETSPYLMERWGGLILAADRICLGIFIVEIALKLTAQRQRFFLNGWNLFDFVIVGIALIPAAGGLSAYTLFQIMTLESWSMGIVRPVMQVYPYAWLFFVPFIMITTFAVVNLLVGLIVNSMQDAHHAEDGERTDAYRDEVLARLEQIDQRLNALGETKK